MQINSPFCNICWKCLYFILRDFLKGSRSNPPFWLLNLLNINECFAETPRWEQTTCERDKTELMPLHYSLLVEISIMLLWICSQYNFFIFIVHSFHCDGLFCSNKSILFLIYTVLTCVLGIYDVSVKI